MEEVNTLLILLQIKHKNDISKVSIMTQEF